MLSDGLPGRSRLLCQLLLALRALEIVLSALSLRGANTHLEQHQMEQASDRRQKPNSHLVQGIRGTSDDMKG